MRRLLGVLGDELIVRMNNPFFGRFVPGAARVIGHLASTVQYRSRMVERYVGRSMGRPEDPSFLRGMSRYVANLRSERDDGRTGAAPFAHVAFVRSPFAHAQIVDIDVAEAKVAPGVLAVVTATDHDVVPLGALVAESATPRHAMPLLAEGTARYVGEPVVAVVAETEAQAVDATEQVIVDWEPLDAVIDVNDALEDNVVLFTATSRARSRRDDDGGPATNVVEEHEAGHDDGGPATNVVEEHEAGHDESCFSGRVDVQQRFWNPRQLPAPIEPYVEVCGWDAAGHLHVQTSTQRPHGFRDQLASLYELDPAHVHVTAPAVGGGFGGKVSRTSEEHVLPLLSRIVGRPVRWVQTRNEYFVGATHGRGEQIDFRLSGTDDGRIIALRGDMVKDSGAYPGVGATLPSRYTAPGASGPYDIAHVEFSARSVVTNAPSISAFRGAGRAPYIAALERLIDMYAARIGMDPADVRRRNLVRREQMPFLSVTGATYDEADYVGDLDRALHEVGYDELRREQAKRRESAAGWQLGIGMAAYHHQTVGAGGSEEARVEITPSGGAMVFTGSTSQGHGHDVTWAQIAADELGMPIDQISVHEGSTSHTATGVGAVGSRSLQTAGVAIMTASGVLVERARQVAARLLEAAPEDVVCTVDGDGGEPAAHFHVVGVPSVWVGWVDVAAEVARSDAPDELVCGETHNVGDQTSFPSGSHVAVVEVDIETGFVRLIRFVGVDDVGNRVNPMVVEGQLHGGIASGLSQVFGEEMRYDGDGNPLTTNFADYLIATADQLPMFELHPSVTSTSFNALGSKGVGESGTVGATPALHNAVIDAVSHLGVEHIELPCTPMRVWQAINDAGAK
ncbi:MAG: xanthine dehydrogenase family protein molybdopterin-binding subunit [Acidimicrobiia bacterium]|nr:xanthine dehydrogenase family protein molybdopterin-binding subunit [Acidimicrobiia bacterium]